MLLHRDNFMATLTGADVVPPLEAKHSFHLLTVVECHRFFVHYFNEKNALLFTDTILTDKEGNVERIFTYDPVKPPVDFSNPPVQGQPVDEVVIDAVFCKQRPGVDHYLVFPVDGGGKPFLVVEAQSHIRPQWSTEAFG